MGVLDELSVALANRPMDFAVSWGTVAVVTQTAQTTFVAFDLFGAPALDATTTTNQQLAGVPTLAAGDKIMVARTGAGAWVILGKVETLGGTG